MRVARSASSCTVSRVGSTGPRLMASSLVRPRDSHVVSDDDSAVGAKDERVFWWRRWFAELPLICFERFFVSPASVLYSPADEALKPAWSQRIVRRQHVAVSHKVVRPRFEQLD